MFEMRLSEGLGLMLVERCLMRMTRGELLVLPYFSILYEKVDAIKKACV
jgi:hypothetical protein